MQPLEQNMYNFEKRFDIIPLPSGGLFYENKCDKVKLFDLTNEDDSILTAPNLIASGEMVDVLSTLSIKRKHPFIGSG